MKKQEVYNKAFDYIGDFDKDAKLIPNGLIEAYAEFMTDFVMSEILNEDVLAEDEFCKCKQPNSTNLICNRCKRSVRDRYDPAKR